MSINTSTGNKMRHGKTFFRARTVCIRSLLAFVSVLFVAGSAFSGNDMEPLERPRLGGHVPLRIVCGMGCPVARTGEERMARPYAEVRYGVCVAVAFCRARHEGFRLCRYGSRKPSASATAVDGMINLKRR